jgi:Mg-chelatase subunit ChlD
LNGALALAVPLALVRFEAPQWLWLLLAIPVVALSWRALPVLTLRRWIALSLRGLLLLALVLALADPQLQRRDDRLSVVAVVDVSGSVLELSELAFEPGGPLAAYRRFFEDAALERGVDDRFGLVAFGRHPEVISMPLAGPPITDGFDQVDPDGTDLASALRLARAILPQDRAGRVVLVSDGGETRGDGEASARTVAASGPAGTLLPIDVMPIGAVDAPEIRLALFEAPTTAAPGETIALRIGLESSLPTEVLLHLARDGRPVAEHPQGIRLALPAGRRIERVEVRLGNDPLQRFEARVEPLEPGTDRIELNNRAEAVVVCPGRRSVLLVREDAPQPGTLGMLLEQAEIPLRVVSPESFPSDLVSLQGWDLVVLEDIAGHRLPRGVLANLAEHVENFGAGLLVTGGPNAFAAGGWSGIAFADLFPVRSELPRRLETPTTAVVFVLDRSGSMRAPVAGARATQQQVANEAAISAIESLGPRVLVGVIAFDHAVETIHPLTLNTEPEALAPRIRRINPAGGTAVALGLAAAEAMLDAAPNLENRLIICLTDGVDRDPPKAVAAAESLGRKGVIINALAVGDMADHETLEKIAAAGNGTYWEIRDPRNLPQVMIESVRLVNAPLVRETPFSPRALPSGSEFSQMLALAPPLGGLALSTPRVEATAILDAVSDEEEPLLARWQAGLGRVAAFTSSVGPPWSGQWEAWPQRDAFWIGLVRWLSRVGAENLRAEARIEGETLRIEAELLQPREGVASPPPPSLLATVHTPSGTRERVTLRQVAPGRFRGEAAARETGAYLVGILAPQTLEAPPAIAAAIRSEGEEFSGATADPELLRRIAEISGGRMLRFPLVEDTPRGRIGLFDRIGLPRVEGWSPAWPLLLWIALPLFWLDVANRRIAWDPAELARTAASSLHRRGGHPAERAFRSVEAAQRAKARAARRHGGA